MIKLPKFKIPSQFTVGFIAGAFSPVLVWLVGLIEPLAQKLIDILQIGGRAGIVSGTDIGTKLIQTLGGKWMIGWPEMFVAGIAGGILVVIGTWIYDQKWSPNYIPGIKPSPVHRLSMILFYASVLATIVLSYISKTIPTTAGAIFSTLLILAVNSIVTSWFVVTLMGGVLGVD